MGRRNVNRCQESRGIALLSVVVVLSTLLTLGVLFAMTVELDLKANRYFRQCGQAHVTALEGVHRATAELQYDVWGVNEHRAFKLADHGASSRLKTAAELGDGGPVAAYALEADHLLDFKWVMQDEDL